MAWSHFSGVDLGNEAFWLFVDNKHEHGNCWSSADAILVKPRGNYSNEL